MVLTVQVWYPVNETVPIEFNVSSHFVIVCDGDAC